MKRKKENPPRICGITCFKPVATHMRVMFAAIMLMVATAGFSQSLGDVNTNGTIDIIDALLVAQYYVGLTTNLDISLSDVNANGTTDIVDALLIAQFYVGLITEFPGELQTPVPTSVQTLPPTPPPTAVPTQAGSVYSFTGTLPNGLINGAPVSYSTTASYDGSNVVITFNGGPGFEWVWLYTPSYNNMSNTGGDTWTASVGGYAPGSTIEFSFTVRKDGQEANSATAPHIWVVGSSQNVTPVPTAAPTAVTTPGPTSAPGDYTLVWSDEFEGSIGPDWVFETGNGSSGWGNNELQYYRRENASVVNGELVITVKQESYDGFNYTSSRMKTEGRRSWTYGKIEARIKLPTGQGIWPAFWMLGDNISSVSWPACGEIDIMEHINNEVTTYGTIHWDADGYAHYGGSVSVIPAEYHLYSIEWDSSAIRWYLDGVQFHEANIENNINSTEEFHRNMFILLNVAVGGNWPGSPDGTTIFPVTMHVDYVRVYQ